MDSNRTRRPLGRGRGTRRPRSVGQPPCYSAARNPSPNAESVMPTRNRAPPPTASAVARSPARPPAGLPLVHVRQLYRLAGRFLHGLGQLVHPCPVLLIGRGDVQGE